MCWTSAVEIHCRILRLAVVGRVVSFELVLRVATRFCILSSCCDGRLGEIPWVIVRASVSGRVSVHLASPRPRGHVEVESLSRPVPGSEMTCPQLLLLDKQVVLVSEAPLCSTGL